MPDFICNINPDIFPMGMNPNINFLMCTPIGSPPNMVPAGSLNIPRFEDTPMGRGREFEEEKYHIRNPTYEPIKFEPIKIEMPKPIKLDMPSYTPPRYEPPIKEFELFPKKHFWDKI